MDTSQLMNHVVHRQLCYTLFTQVPIEPFFQLGLDFLFAGSHHIDEKMRCCWYDSVHTIWLLGKR